MKITRKAWPVPVRWSTDTGGNPVLPNPDSPGPDDPIDVAEDAEAWVPIAPAASTEFIQEHHFSTANTEGDWNAALDDAPTPGNTMVVAYSQRSWNGAQAGEPGTIVVSTGWTYIGFAICGPGNGGATGMWYRVVQPGDTGEFDVVKAASEPGGGWIAEFAQGALLDFDLDGPSSGATSYTTPSLTATGPDQVMIAAIAQSTSSMSLTGDGTADLIATDSVAGGTNGPTYIGQYRITPGSGSNDIDASSGDGQSWASVVALFDAVGTEPTFVPAPLTVDGDDATFNESELDVIVRLDIGASQRLTSSRLLVGYDSSGSRTVHLWASDDPDMAGATDVTDETFTATGGGTGDEVLFTIADTAAYRYWEFRGDAEHSKTFTVEMFGFVQSYDLSGYQLLSEKGDPNGYAPLDGDGLLPEANLPPIALDDLSDVDTSGVSDGDGLVWDSGAGLWVPGASGGGGPSPSGSVEDETTFGITPDAGASSTYSRGDHTHGTPASPGGGGSLGFLGYNTAGGSHLSMGSFNVAKKITLSGAGCIVSIGAYIAMTSLASTTIDVGVFADSGGAPVGPFLAWNRAGGDSAGGVIADNNSPQWMQVPLGAYLPAGDYWIYWGHAYQGGFYEIYYDGSGTDKEVTPSDGIVFAEAIWRTSLASASRKYSLRALILS